MLFAFLQLQHSDFTAQFRKTLLWLLILALLICPRTAQAADEFESRTWTDKKGNQLTSAFVDAKNGEVQLKKDTGDILKFKLSDFSEPDQKYLRDLANYRRKQTAGEKPELPTDPAEASLAIQPRQLSAVEPVPNSQPFRKPLMEFPIRTWRDDKGSVVQGKLVTAYNDKVVLDVKGTVFDLHFTKLSPDDQQYISIQLKGLQRNDLVSDLAKAAAAGQQPGTTPAAPTAVAANTPEATLDQLRQRIEQINAQKQANNPNAGPQAAANTPPAQPLGTDDIKARLAAIRKQKGEPEPEVIPATVPANIPPPPQSPAPLVPQGMTQQQAMAHQQAEMERKILETGARTRRTTSGSVAHPSGQTQVMVKKCSKCGHVVPDSTGIGDACPGCGVHFNYDETNVAGSIGYRIGQGLGVLIIASLVIGGIKKLTG